MAVSRYLYTNKTELGGRVSAVYELKAFSSGAKKFEFQVAHNQLVKGSYVAQYFAVACWSGLAQQASELLQKGVGVVITGRLTQDRWKDASGVEQKRTLITAISIEVLTATGGITTLDGGVSETLLHGVPF